MTSTRGIIVKCRPCIHLAVVESFICTTVTFYSITKQGQTEDSVIEGA